MLGTLTTPRFALCKCICVLALFARFLRTNDTKVASRCVMQFMHFGSKVVLEHLHCVEILQPLNQSRKSRMIRATFLQNQSNSKQLKAHSHTIQSNAGTVDNADITSRGNAEVVPEPDPAQCRHPSSTPTGSVARLRSVSPATPGWYRRGSDAGREDFDILRLK